MSPITDVDLTNAAFRADPYPTYAQWRAEAPVFRVKMPDKQVAWLVTRYDDALTVLKDPRFVTDREKVLTPEQAARLPWTPSVFKVLTRTMLNLDEPDHTRLRGLVHMAFTPRLVANMLQRIQTLTDELLDAVQARGRMDLIRDYALPLPTTIIAEMMGVPVQDRHKFHRWSNALVSSSGSSWGMLRMLPPVWAFLRYIRKLVKIRQADPRDDLVSALVHAREAGDRLSEEELLAMIFLLLVAGHETTVNLIGNGLLALLEHPAQRDRLQDDPDRIKPAVEELLRYDSPVQLASERYAREEVSIAGVTIAPGEMVHALLGSANRDERQFERADDLDIAREPNRHLAFGQGVHYCVGAVWPAWRGRSPSIRCCVGSLTSSWPFHRSLCAADPAWACGGWRRYPCRSPGDETRPSTPRKGTHQSISLARFLWHGDRRKEAGQDRCGMAGFVSAVDLCVIDTSSVPCGANRALTRSNPHGDAQQSLRCPGVLRSDRRPGLQESLPRAPEPDPARASRRADRRRGESGLDGRAAPRAGTRQPGQAWGRQRGRVRQDGRSCSITSTATTATRRRSLSFGRPWARRKGPYTTWRSRQASSPSCRSTWPNPAVLRTPASWSKSRSGAT